MTNPTQSLINFGSIDATYPVAGQDNNSQGFRDNFGAIKSGLSQASTEISALQQNSAFVNSANNFGGNVLTNAKYNQFYGTFLSLGTVNTNTDVNLLNGPFQSVYLGGNVTLTFRNWPAAGSYAVQKLFIYSDGSGVRTPILATAAGTSIKYDTNFPVLPGTSTPGIVVGGEKVISVAVLNGGSGFTSQTSIGFTGGSPQATGTSATATCDYKVGTASVIGGYAGNGYAVGDTITLNANTNVVLSVATLNLTFSATTQNGNATLSGITNFLNLAAGVAISGLAGIPANTYIGSINTSSGTATMVAADLSTPVTATASGTTTVTYVSTTGPIGTVGVTNGGVFSSPIVGSYDVSPITGAPTQTARLVLNFSINSVTVTYGGNGYTAIPAVTVTGGGGTVGTSWATATISTATASNPKVIEAQSFDGGSTVYVKYLGEYH